MQIHYQFIAAAAIDLIAGVGSVSADELSVADTAGDPSTPFALLDGIATEQMSVQELAATRGAFGTIYFIRLSIDSPGDASDIGYKGIYGRVNSFHGWVQPLSGGEVDFLWVIENHLLRPTSEGTCFWVRCRSGFRWHVPWVTGPKLGIST